MRSYPRNSPHAAAQLVALTALADGYLCHSDLQAMRRLDVSTCLGLTDAEMTEVIRGVGEDLTERSYRAWGTVCQLNDMVPAALLDDLDDPDLRRTTLRLCVAVAVADHGIGQAQENLIVAAATQWLGRHAVAEATG